MFHDDRDVEFIVFKRKVINYLETKYYDATLVSNEVNPTTQVSSIDPLTLSSAVAQSLNDRKRRGGNEKKLKKEKKKIKKQLKKKKKLKPRKRKKLENKYEFLKSLIFELALF